VYEEINGGVRHPSFWGRKGEIGFGRSLVWKRTIDHGWGNVGKGGWLALKGNSRDENYIFDCPEGGLAAYKLRGRGLSKSRRKKS